MGHRRLVSTLPLTRYCTIRRELIAGPYHSYSNGESERIVGNAIRKYNIPRERLVILSKCYYQWDTEAGALASNNGKWVNRCGLSRKRIMDAVDQSVLRLGTYIDVLQIHRLDRETPMEEIMRALHDVVLSGKVRYIGASSMYAWEFQMLQGVAEKNGWTKFISMQNYLNLLVQSLFFPALNPF